MSATGVKIIGTKKQTNILIYIMHNVDDWGGGGSPPHFGKMMV